jgi:hypothetical protein
LSCVSAGAVDPRACDPLDSKKTTICHIPPGNPSNAHTLCVGNPAVPAHLGHGDHLGSCGPTCPPATGSGGSSADGGTVTPPPTPPSPSPSPSPSASPSPSPSASPSPSPSPDPSPPPPVQ